MDSYLPYIISIAIGVIAYFLKGTIEDLKDLEKTVQENKITIEVLKSNHNNLGEKLDDLYLLIKEVQADLKVMARYNQMKGKE